MGCNLGLKRLRRTLGMRLLSEMTVNDKAFTHPIIINNTMAYIIFAM
jgi:hypothetical protein